MNHSPFALAQAGAQFLAKTLGPRFRGDDRFDSTGSNRALARRPGAMRGRRHSAHVAVGAWLLWAFAGGAAAQSASACKLDEAGMGTVRAVLDGRTFVLTDGREVRLASIEVPESDAANKAALDKLIGGRDVLLKKIGDDKDRYGRLLAYAFVAGDARSAQQILLAAGHARVAARVGDPQCAEELLRTERAARAAGLGLWSDTANAPRRAQDIAALSAMRGRFALVEGRVVSVRDSGGTIYLNFGRRWSEDFTATVLRRNEKLFGAAGLDLKMLSGRNVRVRGFIEERGGPWIEVSRPEQIEIAGRD